MSYFHPSLDKIKLNSVKNELNRKADTMMNNMNNIYSNYFNCRELEPLYKRYDKIYITIRKMVKFLTQNKIEEIGESRMCSVGSQSSMRPS